MKVIYKQMLEFEDIEDDFDITSSIDEEIEILDEAYRNAYAIVTGKMTVRDLLNKTPDMIFLPFDPNDAESFSRILDDVITYFEENEEYEKCAELISSKKQLDDPR